MTEKGSKDILERDEIGQGMFVGFATDRLDKACSWDSLPRDWTRHVRGIRYREIGQCMFVAFATERLDKACS